MARRRRSIHDDQADNAVTGARPEGSPAVSGADNALDDALMLTISTPRDASVREIEIRQKIAQDAAAGLVAIDAGYALAGHVLHEPLSPDETATLAAAPHDADVLVLNRLNRARLMVRLDDLRRLSDQESDQSALHGLALIVAEHVGGDEMREFMRKLYVLANDAGRSGQFTIRMNRLLDLCGYKTDARGIHRSANRLWVSQALLALHFTHVGIAVTGSDGRRRGSMGNLLSALEYDAPAEAGDLTAPEIFERGLPDIVRVVINPVWYKMRDHNGNLIDNPLLVPRGHLLAPPRHRVHGGRRSAAATLSQFLLDIRSRLHEEQCLVHFPRRELIGQAGITDRDRYNATKTLTKALRRLVNDAVIASYEPTILPVDDDDLIEITFHSVPPTLFADLDDAG